MFKMNNSGKLNELIHLRNCKAKTTQSEFEITYFEV